MNPPKDKGSSGGGKTASSKSKNRKSRRKRRGAGAESGAESAGRSQSAGQSSSSLAGPSPGEGSPAPGGASPSPGRTCAGLAVAAAHALDLVLGLALAVYGVMAGGVPPVSGAAVSYGLVCVLGSAFGAAGYLAGVRWRVRASAAAGAVLCMLDAAAFLSILIGWSAFVEFLDDNADDLLMTEDSVAVIAGLKILFAVACAALAGLELHRAIFMWNLRPSPPRGSPARRRTERASRCRCPFWPFFGGSRAKADDFVSLDEAAGGSLGSPLLWSETGAPPGAEDFLDFVPEHERGLAEYPSGTDLLRPDTIDY